MSAMRLLLPLVFLLPGPALAQSENLPADFPTPTASPVASPEPTPYPVQDPGLGGYDDAIKVDGVPVDDPTDEDEPIPDPDPYKDSYSGLQRHDDGDDRWDPSKAFPGNYYALPLTLDVGWRPCLDCAPQNGNAYDRPGTFSLWAGYAFQPWKRSSAPFMAGGLEWVFVENDGIGKAKGRSQLRPTWRWGWSFTAASVYATSGVILPDQERKKIGYHVGAGFSSVVVLALAACAGEAIPSVVEVGWDFLPDPVDGKMRDEFVLRLGWGF